MYIIFYEVKEVRARNLQMGPTFRDKVIDRVRSFSIKHKRLKFIGMAYAMVVLTFYDLGLYFAHNAKRFSCLASVLFFFVASSSFTYPEAISLNISFVSDFDETENESENYYTSDTLVVSEGESDAELAELVEIDPAIMTSPDAVASEYEEAADAQISSEDIDFEDIEEESVEEIDTSEFTEFSSDDWKLILVNKQHPIPDDYSFPLGDINSTMKCDERVIAPLKAMLKAASDDGIRLVICSPYRDSERQEGLFDRKIKYYMEAGLSYMDAYNMSSQAVTVPGSSEHQIGLAFDIVTGDYYELDEGFGDTPEGQWLANNSYKYGFVVRYLQGKENITSIEYEPWHFRYVGTAAATIMHDENLCLEEFWDNYLYD